MVSFGLITEGITDQIVLESLLGGYFDDPYFDDNDIRYLLPEIDKDKETKKNNSPSKSEYFSNWELVINYCQKQEFRQAFQSIDYVIIHLDTDIFIKYQEKTRKYNVRIVDEEGKKLGVLQFVEEVKIMLIRQIGENFYETHKEKIIFAIAVEEIECWLLPLYYTANNETKQAEITNNCLYKLNEKLKKKEGFTIDKKKQDYEKVTKPYYKTKVLQQSYPKNPSLLIFIQELIQRFPNPFT